MKTETLKHYMKFVSPIGFGWSTNSKYLFHYGLKQKEIEQTKADIKL